MRALVMLWVFPSRGACQHSPRGSFRQTDFLSDSLHRREKGRLFPCCASLYCLVFRVGLSSYERSLERNPGKGCTHVIRSYGYRRSESVGPHSRCAREEDQSPCVRDVAEADPLLARAGQDALCAHSLGGVP